MSATVHCNSCIRQLPLGFRCVPTVHVPTVVRCRFVRSRHALWLRSSPFIVFHPPFAAALLLRSPPFIIFHRLFVAVLLLRSQYTARVDTAKIAVYYVVLLRWDEVCISL